MKYLKLHSWNVSYKRAVEIQEKLEKSIIVKNSLKNLKNKLVAGADVSYTKTIENRKATDNNDKSIVL